MMLLQMMGCVSGDDGISRDVVLVKMAGPSEVMIVLVTLSF